jgi:hypothetical protein
VKGKENRIYGLGGSWKAFVPQGGNVASIKKLKSHGESERDFYEKPPVCATSWERLEEVVDWESIHNSDFGVEAEDVKIIGQRLFRENSAHLILPIKEKLNNKFPFAKELEDSRKNHAFLLGEKGVLGRMVEQWEQIAGDEFLLVTSANKTGKPTLGTWREVVETFPELGLILADNFDGELVRRTGSSSPMYDFSFFPERIGVRRLRSGEEHGNFVQFFLDAELLKHALPDFNFENLYKIVAKE